MIEAIATDDTYVKWHVDRLSNPNFESLCPASPKNFVGSLVLAIHEREILSLASNFQVNPIHQILHPVYLLQDIDYWIGPQQNKRSRKMHARRVLMKQGCGREVGVVLDDDPAGLLLFYPLQQEMLEAHRWWNNADLESKGYPHLQPANRNDVSLGLTSPDSEEFRIAFDQAFMGWFDQLKEQYATSAEAFLALLPQIVVAPPTRMKVINDEGIISQVSVT